MKKNNKKDLETALYDKAVGFSSQEIVEEYNLVDDKLVLSKKKVNTKKYPPDMSALQYLLEEGKDNQNYENLSDEQLQEEKIRLLKLLNNDEE